MLVALAGTAGVFSQDNTDRSQEKILLGGVSHFRRRFSAQLVPRQSGEQW